MNLNNPRKPSFTVIIAGEAGQGIQTIEYLLSKIFKSEGFHIFASKEYMSRIRGGSNSTAIRLASEPVAAYAERIDLLVALDRDVLTHLKERISKQTLIIGEAQTLGEAFPVLDIPLTSIAAAVGNKLYANSVACGAVAGILNLAFESVARELTVYFGSKAQTIIEQNIEAAHQGYQAARQLNLPGEFRFELVKNPDAAGSLILNGSEALALGAIAGGCNFIGSYPMSPGTGVLIYLSKFAAEFGIVAEQAEDEIAAINMGIGAWYAGARAMVTTSGGGFALMTEGVSLAGMIESPMVIHIAQRPGPGTGLPTRTEQGDLDLARYAGHGEFPRLILAPATIKDAFYLTAQAFELADRYQVPAFILTDQFLVDAFMSLPDLPLSNVTLRPQFIKTTADYQRYRFTDDGLSPRGIPGYGEGLVGVDSDEHDEAGHITEDLELRIKMTDKRLQKKELLQKAALPPTFAGDADYHTLVVGWGTTYSVITEALAQLGHSGVAQLHFQQVYPLSSMALDYLIKARHLVVIENNATGQFESLLRREADIRATHTLLKYNGMPFSVEELTVKLDGILKSIGKGSE